MRCPVANAFLACRRSAIFLQRVKWTRRLSHWFRNRGVACQTSRPITSGANATRFTARSGTTPTSRGGKSLFCYPLVTLPDWGTHAHWDAGSPTHWISKLRDVYPLRRNNPYEIRTGQKHELRISKIVVLTSYRHCLWSMGQNTLQQLVPFYRLICPHLCLFSRSRMVELYLGSLARCLIKRRGKFTFTLRFAHGASELLDPRYIKLAIFIYTYIWSI